MAERTPYTDLITAQHANRPKYRAMVTAISGCLIEQQQTLRDMVTAFDLDHAQGAQLDMLGLWVGIGRGVKEPIRGVYFSFDKQGVGLDQGVWKGAYDPDDGVVQLDDDTYRLLIRARIGANHWDGTSQTLPAILQGVFDGTGIDVFVQDNQDMTIALGMSGAPPSALLLALLLGGYLPIKPEAVRITDYLVPGQPGARLFGFDADTVSIGGLDQGAWGTSAARLYT